MADNPKAKESSPVDSSDDRGAQEAFHHIRSALRGLRFGEITVILQDGVVVQVERTERTWIQRAARKS